MKPSIALLSVPHALLTVIRGSIFPTIRGIIKSPLIMFNALVLFRLFRSTLRMKYLEGLDEECRIVKEQLITANAHGVVLDVGAGPGYNVKYLNRTKVTRYVALEPNKNLHAGLRTAANAAGFTESDGTLLILPSYAKDTSYILSSLHCPFSKSQLAVDTIISTFALCSIPSSHTAIVISSLVNDVLAPGGVFLFLEHVLSKRADVRWWQEFWTPVWGMVIRGCRLDVPSDVLIEETTVDDEGVESVWKGKEVWDVNCGGNEKDEESLWCYRAGRLVKRDRYDVPAGYTTYMEFNRGSPLDPEAWNKRLYGHDCSFD